MTVIKEYNPATSQWETILVGKQGPRGESGIVSSATPPDDTTVIWADTTTESNAFALPIGGSAGDSLVKASGDDYDAVWEPRVKSSDISEIVVLTQAQYDLLTPDANVLYVVVG